jgi:hypothetical protein
MPIPKSVAIFNKYVTNRFVLLFAGWVPPLAIIKHRGRKSGRNYRTPVMAFQKADGFVFALTYGRDVDWVKNLLVAKSGVLKYYGVDNIICSFSFSLYEDVKYFFPVLFRIFLNFIKIEDCLLAEKQKLDTSENTLLSI